MREPFSNYNPYYNKMMTAVWLKSFIENRDAEVLTALANIAFYVNMYKHL